MKEINLNKSTFKNLGNPSGKVRNHRTGARPLGGRRWVRKVGTVSASRSMFEESCSKKIENPQMRIEKKFDGFIKKIVSSKVLLSKQEFGTNSQLRADSW